MIFQQMKITTASPISPPIASVNGKRLAIVALCDIDGTVNDETIEESRRLSTIGPASNAIDEIQRRWHVPVGIVTGRSIGEAVHYRTKLNGLGPIICEDGATVLIPRLSKCHLNDCTITVIAHENGVAFVLSSCTSTDIRHLLGKLEQEARRRDPQFSENLITTFSSAEILMERIGYQSIQDAIRASDRLASAFVVNPSQTQLQLITKLSDEYNIRVFSTNLPHLIGRDANKGTALGFLNKYASILFSNSQPIDGILPIAFGNNDNDLKLFESVSNLCGLNVMVGKPGGGYFVDEKLIPDSVLKTKGAYGHGLLESLPEVSKWLATYGLE